SSREKPGLAVNGAAPPALSLPSRRAASARIADKKDSRKGAKENSKSALRRRVFLQPLRLRRVRRDDVPGAAQLAKRTKIGGRVAEFELRRRLRLAGGLTRVHRRIERARRQQRALDRVGRLATRKVL